MAIIKWAGGKNQLLEELNKRLPDKINTYVEPFIGSGALFLDLKPQNAIINDSNRELINLYEVLKTKHEELKEMLLDYQEEYNKLTNSDDKKAYYYARREEFNENIVDKKLSVKDAALFVFLNKTCFNGLYRVNKAGTFNVPWGQRKKTKLYDEADFTKTINALKNARILTGDFTKACEGLTEGDFVYFDPPYYDTFDTYQAGGFSEEDHIRLRDLFGELQAKGVNCMLSNSDVPRIWELYKDFHIEQVLVKRMINRNGNDRTGTEVIITNMIKERSNDK